MERVRAILLDSDLGEIFWINSGSTIKEDQFYSHKPTVSFNLETQQGDSNNSDIMTAFNGTLVDSEEGQVDMSPQNVNEVIISPEAEKWKAAMGSEYQF